MNTAMIQQERRSYSRKTLNPLPYISLAPDSGGLVLDVSEQGLRFRATGPLELSGPIRFSFSAHSDLVEGIADLVWTDPANKTGGLRFTELSDDARAMIRKWPHESDLQLSVGQDFMLQMPPRDDSWRIGARLRGAFEAAFRFASSGSKRLASAGGASLPSGQKEGAAIPSGAQLESLFTARKRSLLGALSITIVVILVSTWSYVRHREVGEWLVRLGTRISGEGHPQAITQTPASAVSVSPSVADGMSGDESKVASAPEQASPQAANAANPVVSNANVPGLSLPPAPAAHARHLSPAAHGGDLVVQVAALRREADAREMADSLRHKNFQAFVRTLPADALYRVLLGPYANKADASAAVAELKKSGYSSFVRWEPGAELSGSLRIPAP
jgi:hypothetical protein